MEVSHFELVYKPQSPIGPADTVLQGYFLEISNLEDVDLYFRLDFVTSPVTDPDRSLNGNTAVLVDSPGVNNAPASLVGALDAKSFRLTPLVAVPACGTTLVAVLPSDPFGGMADPANFEARGYVTLRLPAIFRPSGRFFVFGPQLDRPAEVLLTAQNRALYQGADGTNSAQTQSSLPLAGGDAKRQVPAESLPELRIDFSLAAALENYARLPRIAFEPESLALMLAAAHDAEMETDEINGVLAEAGYDIGIVHKKRKKK